MKTLILAGFLGAGKTTVLLELAKHLTQTGQSVVILENEISSSGVDNRLLASRGFTVRNIFAGCICCTSTGELCGDVERIRKEFAPDWLIIEATGMAYPDGIRDALEKDAGIPASILTMVDSVRWNRVLRGLRQFVLSQLQGANAVLITKIDKVDAETLDAVTRSVREFAPDAPIHPICALEPQSDGFWPTLVEGL